MIRINDPAPPEQQPLIFLDELKKIAAEIYWRYGDSMGHDRDVRAIAWALEKLADYLIMKENKDATHRQARPKTNIGF